MWKHNNKELTVESVDKLIEDGYVGFVYEILDKSTMKKYIGKKGLVSIKRLPPLKGKKRKRVVRKQSDWATYYGSSELVKTLIEEHGTENFERKVLRLCKTKGEMSYYEAKLQFEFDVLLSDDFYNEFVGCKIHAKHIGHLKESS